MERSGVEERDYGDAGCKGGDMSYNSVVEERYGGLWFESLGYEQGMERGNVVNDYHDAGCEEGEMGVVDESYSSL